MKRTTLLFGGAFDPPHKSHIITALTAMNHEKFNNNTDLWFLPCYSDAFGQKDLTDAAHRISMLEHIVDFIGDNRIKVCTTEIEMANSAGTYVIVNTLRNMHPDREFYYIVGSDQASNIRRWRNSRNLLKTIPFVVIRRPFYSGYIEWCFKSPHIWIEDLIKIKNIAPKETCQSSDIRQIFYDDWERSKKHLPEGLLFSTYRYIIDNELYKK